MKKRSLPGLRADQQPKLSQEEMAVRVGRVLGRPFSAARYWQIEKGFRTPATDDEKRAIASVLGARVSDIAWPAVALGRTA